MIELCRDNVRCSNYNVEDDTQMLWNSWASNSNSRPDDPSVCRKPPGIKAADPANDHVF